MSEIGTNNKSKLFLENISTIQRKRIKARRATASIFNVFEAMRLARQELSHSIFIRYLLDQNGHHSQGAMFLHAFLRRIVKLEIEDALGIRVQTEQVLKDYGRIDLSINFPNGLIVLIENKVDHVEGEEQIERYLKWLAGQKPPSIGEHKLIFLTPDGRAPLSAPKGAQVITASYCDIAEWISELLPHTPARIQTVLVQYKEICENIGGVMSDDRVELKQFLRDEQNLELGFDVASVVAELTQEASDKFWCNVKHCLQERINSSDAKQLWEAFESRASNGLVGIGWKGGDRGNHSYCVTVEVRRSEAQYGISRNRGLQQISPRESELIDELKKDGFIKLGSEWWCGILYLHNISAGFAKNDDRLRTIELMADNSSHTHPLADKVSNVLWELFVKHRETLENLNNSYPY